MVLAEWLLMFSIGYNAVWIGIWVIKGIHKMFKKEEIE